MLQNPTSRYGEVHLRDASIIAFTLRSIEDHLRRQGYRPVWVIDRWEDVLISPLRLSCEWQTEREGFREVYSYVLEVPTGVMWLFEGSKVALTRTLMIGNAASVQVRERSSRSEALPLSTGMPHSVVAAVSMGSALPRLEHDELIRLFERAVAEGQVCL